MKRTLPNKSTSHNKPGSERNISSNNDNGTRKAVLSVTQFAHRSGETNSLLLYRERKQQKRIQKAIALRSYTKVKKQVLGTTTTPTSNIRKSDGDNANLDRLHVEVEMKAITNNTDVSNVNEELCDLASPANGSPKNDDDTFKRSIEGSEKMNPENSRISVAKKNRFTKAIQKRNEREHLKEEFQRLKEQQEQQKKLALLKRKQRSKLLSSKHSKTRRGQPIMKNIVHDILNRLEAEK